MITKGHTSFSSPSFLPNIPSVFQDAVQDSTLCLVVTYLPALLAVLLSQTFLVWGNFDSFEEYRSVLVSCFVQSNVPWLTLV